MKIGERLKLNTWLALVAVLLMAVALFWSYRQIGIAERNEELVNAMRKAAFERMLLRGESFLGQSPRAAVQWQAKTESLRGLLAEAAARFTTGEERTLLQEAQRHFDETTSLSSGLMKTVPPPRAGASRTGAGEREKRLLSQLLLRAYNLNESLDKLYEATERAARQTRNRGFLLTFFLLLGGGLAVIANSLATRQIIAKRLKALHQGVVRIGGGDLEHRIEATGDDELADLAAESNQMAVNLKESYTAIENLHRENAARQAAEEKLRRNEENFRRSLDDSPLGVRIVSEDGETIYTNRALLDIYGYDDVEELRRRSTEDRYTPESYAAFRERRDKRRRGEETPGEYEIAIVRKDGEVRHLRVFRKPILWDGVSRYQVLYNDITEQKRAEESLRLSEERYRAFVKQSSEAICLFEIVHAPIDTSLGTMEQLDQLYTHAVIGECNRTFAVSHGYERPEDMLGFRIGQVFPRLARENVDYLRAFIENGHQIANVETKELARDGTVKYFLNSLTGQVESGFLLRVWGAKQDISRIKQAEADLRKKDLTLAILASQVPGMLYQFLRKTDGSYALPYSSDGIRDIFGCAPGDVQDDFTPAGKAILEEDRNKVYESIEESSRTMQPWKCEFRVCLPDKGKKWIYANSLPERAADGSVVWYGYAVDVTEHKEAEAAIRKLNEELERRVRERTAELEAANREMEAFTYSVSHDLRAPLRAVDGYTRILMEDYGKLLDREGQRICGVISDSARDMGRLIDSLLSLSRLSRQEMRRIEVDMAALAESVYRETTGPAERVRIDFQVASLPPAQGDPALLRQVWVNLLGNAVKFSRRQEQARIEVGWTKGAYFVRDNGAGFDMAYAGKLFGVFQRLHSAREFEGTGAGLAIAQRIVHRHGGRIWGEGEVGKGATFFFTLPE